MKLVYGNEKIQLQCTTMKYAQKLFGGDKALAVKLLGRINQLESADVIRDIILTPPLRFHNLEGNWNGYFAIDVKTKREPWRIIIQPLDENEKPYDPCNIDEISNVVKIVEVKEVSKHYE